MGTMSSRSAAKSTPSRAGRPPRISRPEILATARRLVEEEGPSKLTMRRLAREVDSTPMALYHHVRDKRELLLLLLDDVAARLPRPELPDDPAERMIAVAATLRTGLAECPWVVEVLTADDLLSPGALWFVEKIVAGGVDGGLSHEDAVQAYRTIWYYTVGELVVRAASSTRRREEGEETHRAQVFAELDPGELPQLSALASRWSELTARDSYDSGLRALVYGLLAAGS